MSLFIIFKLYATFALFLCITSAGQMMQETQGTNPEIVFFNKRNVVCPCGRRYVAGISCLMRRGMGDDQPKRLVKRGKETGACQCLPCPSSGGGKNKNTDPTGMPQVVKTGSAYEKAVEACVLKNTITAIKDPKAETPRCSEVVKDPDKHK
jgi:hypothetical protein